MKTFIYRTTFFLALCLLIVAGYHYSIYRLFLSNDSFYKINDGASIVVVGDSHSETAINDELTKDLQNYSYKGESIFLIYYKLKKILDVNPQINKVLLSFSYHSLNDFQDTKLPSLLYEYYWLLDMEGLRSVSPSIDNLNMILKDMNGRLYQWLTSNIKRNDYHLLTGGYRRLDIHNLSEESSHERILKHYYEADRVTTQKYSDIQKIYFDKIVSLCVEKNIQLSFINTPLHKSYYSNIPQQYISSYYSLVDDIKNNHPDMITLLEFRDTVTADNLFHDGDHINAQGGKIFMEALNKKLFPQIKEDDPRDNHH